MKTNKIAIIIGLAVLIIGTSLVFSSAGDSNDPIVSLSYLNERLEAISGDVKSDKLILLDDKNLKKGDIIIGEIGTEIILRGGKASAYGVSKNAGLSDLTDGVDITDNKELIPHNHLLVIPRDDGRGIKIESDAIWVLIKGEYEIR